MLRWLIDKINAKRDREQPSRWVGGSAWRYGVGRAPAQKPVDGSTSATLRPTGVSVFTDGRLAFGPRCGECVGCVNGFDRCFPRDGHPDHPHAPSADWWRCSLCSFVTQYRGLMDKHTDEHLGLS